MRAPSARRTRRCVLRWLDLGACALSHSLRARLVEGPVEGVLVVDHGGDEGEDEAAGAPHLRVPRAVLHVLPQDARVLLMHAHSLLQLHRLACGAGARQEWARREAGGRLAH